MSNTNNILSILLALMPHQILKFFTRKNYHTSIKIREVKLLLLSCTDINNSLSYNFQYEIPLIRTQYLNTSRLKYITCVKVNSLSDIHLTLNLHNLKKVIFKGEFNEILTENIFPNRITHIKFNDSFNQPIKKNTLPNCLKELELGTNFNNEIEIGALPNSLKELTFGSRFNQIIYENMLPYDLTKLILGCDFNSEIKCNLPNLKDLKFFGDFNRPIIFPNNLTYLYLTEFNKPLQIGTLSNSLTTLKMYRFNNELYEKVLPPELTTLYFWNFNLPLNKNVLPNLTMLYMNSFNQEIDIGVLPSTLKKLVLGNNFNKKINCGVLPSGLTHLKLGHSFDQELKFLPISLKKIYLSANYKKILDIEKLKCLIKLQFTYSREMRINKHIIPNIEKYLGINGLNVVIK